MSDASLTPAEKKLRRDIAELTVITFHLERLAGKHQSHRYMLDDCIRQIRRVIELLLEEPEATG